MWYKNDLISFKRIIILFLHGWWIIEAVNDNAKQNT